MSEKLYMVPNSLHRIVATWRQGAEDPKSILPTFERAARELLGMVSETDIRWYLEHPEFSSPTRETYQQQKDEVNRSYKIESALTTILYRSVQSKHGQGEFHKSGEQLFRAILLSYELPKQVRTKVEEANRFFAKVRKPSIPREPHALVEAYQKLNALVLGYLAAAKQAVLVGKGHSEETTQVQAGRFKLVNTGGFDDKVMDKLSELVSKATELLKKKRLDKVCYGDVQITKTLRKTSTLAFYLKSSDELFIRANAPKTQDTLQVILHELGHRMENRFLRSREDDVKAMYKAIGRTAMPPPPAKILPRPTKGESIVYKGTTLYVISVDYSPRTEGYFRVRLDPDPNTTKKPTMSATLAGFAVLQGKISPEEAHPTPYITPYAKSGGPSENFAEMFAFYCMDKLPEAQVEMLEKILF